MEPFCGIFVGGVGADYGVTFHASDEVGVAVADGFVVFDEGYVYGGDWFGDL